MDKVDLIINDRQTKLRALQAELTDALTGIESPDYEWAARIQPLIYGVQAEIKRLERLRLTAQPSKDFCAHISRLLTDNTVTTLELWVGIRDHWNDVTVCLLEIRKWKSGYFVTCTLRLAEPLRGHLYGEYTTAELQHLGWTAGRGGRKFWFKTRIKSPDQFDSFNQRIAVTMLEALASLWAHGQQYYRFK